LTEFPTKFANVGVVEGETDATGIHEIAIANDEELRRIQVGEAPLDPFRGGAHSKIILGNVENGLEVGHARNALCAHG
jgi:hypothetical protein